LIDPGDNKKRLVSPLRKLPSAADKLSAVTAAAVPQKGNEGKLPWRTGNFEIGGIVPFSPPQHRKQYRYRRRALQD
jgi:hypothetical protein